MYFYTEKCVYDLSNNHLCRERLIYANEFETLRWVWVSFAETGLAGLNLSLYALCPSTGLLQNLISLYGTRGTRFVPPRDFCYLVFML